MWWKAGKSVKKLNTESKSWGADGIFLRSRGVKLEGANQPNSGMQTCLKQRWATNEMTVKAYCYYKMSGAVETSTTTELVSKKYYHYRIVLMLSHCTRAISLMLTIKDHAQRKCLTTHREKLQWATDRAFRTSR
jgi:hypothetical protein